MAAIRAKNHTQELFWAGIKMSSLDAPYHYLFVGVPGTGKSLTMGFLMDGLREAGGVVYDFQKNMTETLARHGIDITRYRYMNPYHRYTAQWKLAWDLTNWELAYEATAAFFPTPKQQGDAFWSKAPRLVMTVLMTTLNKIARDKGKKPEWELRDLVLIATNKKSLKKICSIYPDLYAKIEPIFSDETSQMADSVLFTISVEMAGLQSIAQLWHYAGLEGRNVSLYDVLNEDIKPIFLLGREEVRSKEALARINAIVLNFMAKIFLDLQTDNKTGKPRFWFFIDELPSIDRVSAFVQIAVEGRKLGLVLVLAFQSYSMMQKVYGVEDAAALVGMLNYTVLFRITEPATQEWAVKLIGDHQVNRPNVSNAKTKQFLNFSQVTQSISYSPVIEKLMLESEFAFLSLAGEGNLEAIVKFGSDTIYRWKVPTDKIVAVSEKLYPPKPELKKYNYIRVPEEMTELKYFTADDMERLYLPIDFFPDVTADADYAETLSILAAEE